MGSVCVTATKALEVFGALLSSFVDNRSLPKSNPNPFQNAFSFFASSMIDADADAHSSPPASNVLASVNYFRGLAHNAIVCTFAFGLAAAQ